jgi:ubiquitin C-terminal hydrolase
MDITATLDIIEQEINLNNILDLIPDPEQTSESVYSLKGMICYYGMHYDAYCKVGDVWWVFDDAMVKEVLL